MPDSGFLHSSDTLNCPHRDHPVNRKTPSLDPADLLAALRANDRAVMVACGFDLKMAESDSVAELFKLYQSLAAND